MPISNVDGFKRRIHMIIQHNIAALNATRNLKQANSQHSKSIEKLSSGLRINQAADDAAGLAISEKMRGQINGLKQAQRNSQDGISLIQTAESGLNETHGILQKMRELSVKAANDTNTTEDRKAIQEEINQLNHEIDNIANGTEFNTINLLNRVPEGSNQDGVSIIDGSETQLTSTADYDTQPSWVGNRVSFTRGDDVFTMDADGSNQSLLISGASQSAVSSVGTQIAYVRNDGNLYTANIDGTSESQLTTSGDVDTDQTFGSRLSWGPSGNEVYFKSTNGIEKVNVTTSVKTTIISDSDSSSPSVTPDGQKLVYKKSDGIYMANSDGTNSSRIHDGGSYPIISPDGTKIAFTEFSNDTNDDEIYVMNLDGSSVTNLTGDMSTASSHDHNIYPVWSSDGQQIAFHSDNMDDPSTTGDIWAVDVSNGSSRTNVEEGNELILHIGSNESQSMRVFLTDARSSSLGVQSVSVLTNESAGSAILKIDHAITEVSEERSKYGAYQNRLEHASNNLMKSFENLTTSESIIRDVDMAKESMNQTKLTILSQASQAMLQKQIRFHRELFNSSNRILRARPQPI